MKSVLSLFTILFLSFGVFAGHAEASEPVAGSQMTSTDVSCSPELKIAKELFDGKLSVDQLVSRSRSGRDCGGYGSRCDSSLDCCGSSFCKNGRCDLQIGECAPYGRRCENSLDCCGGNFCREGRCK
jgi:hypothetical protein